VTAIPSVCLFPVLYCYMSPSSSCSCTWNLLSYSSVAFQCSKGKGAILHWSVQTGARLPLPRFTTAVHWFELRGVVWSEVVNLSDTSVDVSDRWITVHVVCVKSFRDTFWFVLPDASTCRQFGYCRRFLVRFAHCLSSINSFSTSMPFCAPNYST